MYKHVSRIGQVEETCGGRVHGTIRTVHTTYAAALKTTTHPKIRCRNHMLQLNI
jgi:hypothetical protein